MLSNQFSSSKRRSNCFWLSLSITLISISGCRKLVESPIPTESVAETNVFSTDATAISVLNDIYSRMNTNGQPFQGAQSFALFAGLSADELTPASNLGIITHDLYYKNNLQSPTGTGSAGTEQWAKLYNFIFRSNAAIEGLNKSNALTQAVKQQLLGEAKLLRAFYHFYLVNLFGDIPLVLTTDPEVNRLLSRSTKSIVYAQIIADLKDAEGSLSDNYLGGTLLANTTERIRPTKWAASALLARVYLYINDYVNAENRATEVINNTSLFGPLPTLNNAFLKNSREAIWQLQPTAVNFNTVEAQTLIIPNSPGGTTPVFLNKQLLSSFEPGDQRRALGNWMDTAIYTITNSPLVRDTVTYAYKYKIYLPNTSINNQLTGPQFMTEYFMVFRLGEQYLIRAEARAYLGKTGEAQSDLNQIRTRAGLPNTTAADQTSLLTAILKERQTELFCEWGHRWLDLKRTGKVDAIMTVVTPIKSNGATFWQPHQSLYPLPFRELQYGANLVQNPGY